jgi:uncharacterized spore protein YtfJ
MAEGTKIAPGSIDQPEQPALQFANQIFAAARASAVYSAPVTAGAYTVITASEVTAGGGFGSGEGRGPAANGTPAADADSPVQMSSGGGSGGGGGSSGRPVAVIVVGPDGVQVKPIFDVTKFGLAVVTSWAAMLLQVLRMRRALGHRSR